MPIEVRELVIKAVVNSEEKPTTKRPEKDRATKEHITDGLERLLELIKNRNER